jgi:N-acetylglucosaminyldiphosphoundecaprenol N-acetyl-beta-D-mannosaminyltransferase
MINQAVVEILGIKIHDITLDEVMVLVKSMVTSRKPHHITPINPEMIIASMKNEEFRKVLIQVSLGLPDGIGILIAGRLFGKRIRERVTGVDTVMAIANMANNEGYSIFLLGAAPGIAERASSVLKQKNPGLSIAGTFAGSPEVQDEDEICSRIQKVKPDILFVAYGAPRQELWIARTMKRLNVPVAMSVGGTFDFIAGVNRRAPRWMQRAGLEWFFRLVQEPSRWRRMLALPKFIVAVMLRKFNLA